MVSVYNMDDEAVADQEVALDQIHFVAYNVVALLICAIGIVGNVISLVVLTRPNMKVRIIIHLPESPSPPL